MYAKLNPDRKTLTPAPRSYGATCNPSAATHLAHGYKLVVDEPPEIDAAHYAAPTGWLELSDRLEREYEVRENPPPPPRTFSKYRLVSALMQAGVWPQVKAWIEGVPGAYDLYLAAEDVSEDEPLLAQGIAAVKEMLGWTDAQVEAVLAASAKE